MARTEVGANETKCDDDRLSQAGALMRVTLLLIILFSGLCSFAQPSLRLQVVPADVYKVDDPGNAKTSSFVFNVAVICPEESRVAPVSAWVELSAGGVVLERDEWTAAMLEKIKQVSYKVLAETPIASPRRVFTIPETFDVRLTFTRPQTLAIDSARVQMTVADEKGRRLEKTVEVPIRTFQQKTRLSFPFAGHGMVTQGWITDGGHAGYANQFAVDVIGLDDNYAPQHDDKEQNSSYVGWGRTVLAPAEGKVVYARNDVPNNPGEGEPDVKTYSAQHDPVMAVAGNCVMIDHGDGEYSVMMHMQQGSVMVKVGDHVISGQPIGKLGNSGDSYAPHLHYQLQAGPDLFRDQSLPFSFQNIQYAQLTRGTYFTPK